MGESTVLLGDVLYTIVARADTALIPYGDALAPAHEMVTGVGQLIDQDTDALAKVLPPDVVKALRVLLRYGELLSDGEALPKGEPLPMPSVEALVPEQETL
jgi:hypothetical protein